MQFLIHAANLLYLASYFSRDALRLRLLAIIAALCLIPYLYCQSEPLIGAVCWNAFFAALNGWWVVRLMIERRYAGNSDDVSEVRPDRQTMAFDVKKMMEVGERMTLPRMTNQCCG